jgi:osmoprotectant transport system permease protein
VIALGKIWPARLDRLGVIIAILVLGDLVLLPFASFSPNRILLGEPRSVQAALSGWSSMVLVTVLMGSAAIALIRGPDGLRLAAGFSSLLILILMVGQSGTTLAPEENPYARVSPASGFWVLCFANALLCADALVRLRLSPLLRLTALVSCFLVLSAMLASGVWDDLSLIKEYATRADAFWREGRRHIVLAFGSLGIAAVVGIPLGVVCYRVGRVRAPILNFLNIIQTIPSIALFGLLIGPLAWIAANLPGARMIGISGIGVAPALIALFAYSLLPIVSNTVSGLVNVPSAARDAAEGMGMTEWQRLLSVEIPLAFPVILTAIRIVLVQNIGLATIAALIGGGGFGVFVFQGMGQTATDLILLGALPTVLLAFASAIVLDALVEISRGRRGHAP